MKLNFTPEKQADIRARMVLIAFAALLLALLYYFPPIWGFVSQVIYLLTPLFVGISVAFVLYRPQKELEALLRKIPFMQKTKAPARVLSTLTVILGLLVLLGLFISLVMPQVVQSVRAVAKQGMDYVEQHTDDIRAFLVQFNILDAKTNELITDWKSLLSQMINFMPSVMEQVISVSGSIVSVLANFLIGLVTSVYILLDKERLFALSKKIGYACIDRAKMDRLIFWTRRGGSLFSGFISGKLLDAGLIGILCYLGMRIFGWEYPVLIAVIIGVTNIVPFFGPFIGWTPSVLILLFINPMHALWFTVFIVILQQLDGNVIGPFILGDRVGLSPLSITVAILVGGGLFGIVGMLVSVPCYALLYGIFGAYVSARLKGKGLSAVTADYQDAPEVMKPCREEENRSY